MPDKFAGRTRSLNDPAVIIFEIIPDDAIDLVQVTTALSVETPGKVRITTVDGSTGEVTIHPGHPLSIRATRVWQTGTSATGLRGLV